ncbi:MAG: alkaline phosphatase family protein [Methylomonas sp.]|jgi:phospholipase C
MAENNSNPNAQIKHLFVLMMENRSFDHMLGFSNITGVDAETGQPTAIDGVSQAYSNSYNDKPYQVKTPADWSMSYGPAHELKNALHQLCGEGVAFPPAQPYPPINQSGYVYDFATDTTTEVQNHADQYGDILKCYQSQTQLPVLYTLATEFAVCDHWFSSLPGPTWPNRFFVHGATSHGLDDSPTTAQMALWEGVDGFEFDNGSIFQALENKGLKNPWRIYCGKQQPFLGSIPCVAALSHIKIDDYQHFDRFAADIQGDYPYFYTFIEPNYGDLSNGSYAGGQSQHPKDDVRNGEQLIKEVYETIRNSPLWENSLLIITYDEHGGFFDHVTPPPAVAPGDDRKYAIHGFDFQQLGVRVPAVVISPYIPKGAIDHRVYDHSSIPATLEALVGLAPLTRRDAAANNLTGLLSLSEPRQDTPYVLPDSAADGVANAKTAPPAADTPDKAIVPGNLPAFLFTAAKLDNHLNRPADKAAVFAKSRGLQTHGKAKAYLNSVGQQISQSKKAKPGA